MTTAEITRMMRVAEARGAARVASAVASAKKYGFDPIEEANRMARVIAQEVDDPS